MNNIGDLLKSSREEKGLTLADMQRETKLQMKYLDALENNNLDLLPGEIYYESFVRKYAEVLDLKVDHLFTDEVNMKTDERQVISGGEGQESDLTYSDSESKAESMDEKASLQSDAENQETSVSFDKPIGFVRPEKAVKKTPSGVEIEFEEKLETAEDPVIDTKNQKAEPLETNPERDYKDYDDNEDEEDDETENHSFFERYGCSIIIIMLVIIAALLLFFYFNSQSDSGQDHLNLQSSQSQELDQSIEDSTVEESSEEGQEPENEEINLEEETTPTASLEQISADGSNATYQVNLSGADSIEVSLTATGETAWASLSADGERIQQGNIPAGGSMTASLPAETNSIEISIGNAEETDIEINGQSVDYPEENIGNPTQYLTFQIQA